MTFQNVKGKPASHPVLPLRFSTLLPWTRFITELTLYHWDSSVVFLLSYVWNKTEVLTIAPLHVNLVWKPKDFHLVLILTLPLILLYFCFRFTSNRTLVSMWCQDTFFLPERQWHVTLRRKVCSSRPADKWKLVIPCSVQMDRARQVCTRVSVCVGAGRHDN